MRAGTLELIGGARFGVLIIIIWLLLMPKGIGLHYITYFVLGLVSAGYVCVNQKHHVGKYGRLGFFLILTYAISYAMSFLLNLYELRAGSLFELVRPMYMAAIFFLGYVASVELTKKHSRVDLFAAWLKSCIVVAVGVSAVQLYAPTLFDVWWSAEKTRGLDSYVRVTGTMYNPNIFAFFISFCALGILASSVKKQRYFWLFIVFVFVLMSGSRTVAVSFTISALTLMLMMALRSEMRKKMFEYVLFGALAFFVMVLMYWSISSRSFYVFNELQGVIQTKSLLSVNSLNDRYEHLNNIYTLWRESGLVGKVFGLGSVPALRVGDNEFVSALFRLGWVGLTIFVVIYLYAFKVAWLSRNTWQGMWAFSVFVMILISGFTMEFLQSWLLITLMFLMIGMASSIVDDERKSREKIYSAYL